MKFGIIISVIFATCLVGNTQEISGGSQVNPIPFEVFYRESYTKIMNSDKIVGFINKCVESDEMSESEKLFYSAGFVRGLLEMSTVEKFKENPGAAFYNWRGIGANAISEKHGWSHGCRMGNKIGDKILEAYNLYLEMDVDNRNNISASDIHIALPHIEKDANKAQKVSPGKSSD